MAIYSYKNILIQFFFFEFLANLDSLLIQTWSVPISYEKQDLGVLMFSEISSL